MKSTTFQSGYSGYVFLHRFDPGDSLKEVCINLAVLTVWYHVMSCSITNLASQMIVTNIDKGRIPKKNRDFLGIFPKCCPPLPPPFGNPSFQKQNNKNKGVFGDFRVF